VTRRLTFVIATGAFIAATGLIRVGAQGRGQAEPPPEISPHLVYIPMDVAERRNHAVFLQPGRNE